MLHELHKYVTLQLPNTIQLNPSSEASSSSSSREFPAIYGARRFNTVFTIARYLSPIMSQMNPIHSLQLNFFRMHINIILLSMPRSSWWSYSLELYYQQFIHAYLLSYALHMFYKSRSPPFEHHNSPWGLYS
jgi:hypothetical protein